MMIKHALKLIWTQRKKNGWILLELFLVFILLWYIVDFFVVLAGNSLTPQGTDIRNTYLVTYNMKRVDNPGYISYGEGSEEPGKNFLRMVSRIRQHPDVEAVSIGKNDYPYCPSSHYWPFQRDSFKTGCQVLTITPEYFHVFKVRPENGGSPEELRKKPFENKDEVILTKEVERKLFPQGSAIGRYIMDNDSSRYRVVAVTTDIKPHDYTRSHTFLYKPVDMANLLKQDDSGLWYSMDICIRTKAGVSARDFPERFKKEMKESLAIGNFFLTDVIPLSKIREFYLKSYGIISSLQYHIGFACFFLINIFLGVLGTFWLRVERRRSEIGLRMAVGSSRKSVLALMQTEGFCLLLLASIPALIVCINLAAMDIMPTDDMDFTSLRFLTDTLLTYLLLGVVILFSTWYPAHRSAKTEPAEALHYE
ncbi:ABC transporter permease [Parabacteroides sp. Marseille-P3160]|uniref:ABC transporter permease n=1 Tax=Parabacteroides sp. Marseille-P3160 TaxID=1917887 RepID=UPI0009BB866F|nr:FtsX-like permease family protein [Parabacteroides sp. Marseille-P3160]